MGTLYPPTAPAARIPLPAPALPVRTPSPREYLGPNFKAREPPYNVMVQMCTTTKPNHERDGRCLTYSAHHKVSPVPYHVLLLSLTNPYLTAYRCLWRPRTRVGIKSMEEFSESLLNDSS